MRGIKMEIEAILTTEDVRQWSVEDNIRQWLVERVAKTLFIGYNDIDCDAHLTELGLDSQEALCLVADLEDLIDCRMPPSVMEDIGSINKLVHIASRLEE